MRNIGERIKFYRNNLGLSQEKLASLVGIDRSHIAKIETGESKGSITVLCKLAAALGISVAELLNDEQGQGIPQPSSTGTEG
jgi:transcriptional regulator with XRE-family HTH domain